MNAGTGLKAEMALVLAKAFGWRTGAGLSGPRSGGRIHVPTITSRPQGGR